MTRIWLIGIGIVLCGTAGVVARGEGAAEGVREGPVVLSPRGTGLGERVADLGFTDVAGKAGRLSDFADRRALVICMTSASCPVARKYGPVIVELEKRYAGKGVAFVAVNA